jgi:transcriptional regulator of acetoin/glycerol metabolism
MFFDDGTSVEESQSQVAIENLDILEEATIRRVLERYNFNMSKVSRKLGVGRSTLYRKLKKYGIPID